jgi:hypothetical protein
MRGQDQDKKIVFVIHLTSSGLQLILNRRYCHISAPFRVGAHDDRVRIQLMGDDVSCPLGFTVEHALCPKQSKG